MQGGSPLRQLSDTTDSGLGARLLMRTSDRSRSAFTALFLLVGTVLAAGQAAIKIAPRDQLAISVWNGGVKEESYSGEFLIDIDSTFEYPTLGRIKAGGLTAREV